MTPPRKPLGKSPRLADTRYEVRAAVEAVCSHWPLPATRKPVPGLFDPGMAHASSRHERGDLRRDSLEFLGLPLAPGDDAVGTKPRRAEQVGHRLRHPVLGKELLHIEINCRRSHARAILSRRRHPLGERRRGLAAAVRAAINHRLMFGDHQPRLGRIEHLPLLNARDHRGRQPGEAMAARLRFVALDDVGLCDRLQRVAGVSGLPAARLARLAAQAAGDARRLLQPSLDGLAAVRAVLVQLTPEVRHFLAQRRVLKPAKPQSRAAARQSGRESRVGESSIP